MTTRADPPAARLWLLLVLLLAVPARAAGTDCRADRIDARARVAYVYDGDTVRLADGRKLRLIGLDTPELGHDGQASQPFARRARTTLTNLLGSPPILALRYDRTRHDRYRRTLAHGFLANGHSVAASLLERGLATTLVIPPNVWSAECYAAAERRARRRELGLWSLPAYRPLAAADLPSKATGLRLITGRIHNLQHRAKGLSLSLGGGLWLTIDDQDLPYFSTLELAQLVGRRIEAHGWLHGRDNHYWLRIRHPSALRVID